MSETEVLMECTVNQVTITLNYLITFALIVSAHPYCSCKFTNTSGINLCAKNSTERNNDRQMAIAMALPGFNNVGCSVTPIVLSRNTTYFVYNNYYLHFVQK